MAPKPKPERQRSRHFIKDWRIASGHTQMTAAEAIGVNQSSVSKIERGETPYDQDFLEIAAPIFGCSPVDLIIRAPDDGTPKWHLCELIGQLDDNQLMQVKSLVETMIATRKR